MVRGRSIKTVFLLLHLMVDDAVLQFIYDTPEDDGFCEEIERAFDQFSRYHKDILLGDFGTEVGRENIFEPIIVNENVHP